MSANFTTRNPARRHSGMTLVELMVAMTVSLMMVIALVKIFVNTSSANTELAKTSYLMEDGRVAMRMLSEELVHAGFWGGYVPRFDDLTYTGVPADVPSAIPNPCLSFGSWDATYRNNSLGVAFESTETLPSGSGCLSPLANRAGSDVLIVRHADTCLPGTTNCEPDAAGSLYFQHPLCEQEKQETAQGGTFNTITFDNVASAAANAYVGATLRTTAGTGAGQYRVVSAYSGARVATVSSNWVATPDSTTMYSLEYMLGTVAFPLHKRNCTTLADKRRFVSNIYYVADLVQNGETVPTLVRSQLEFAGGVLAQQAPIALVNGVEAVRAVVGIDDIGKSGGAIDYANEVTWADPNLRTTATNRGDGAPDRFVRCTTAAPCDVAALTNVVAVKLYVLTRSKETSPNYTDSKTYCLGEPLANGTCAAADTIGPLNDRYKRHVFSTSVRLTNVSGRRDTP